MAPPGPPSYTTARMADRISKYPALVAALLVVSAGCGKPAVERASGPRDLDGLRVAVELADRAAGARPVRTAPVIDVGSAEAAASLGLGWSDPEVDPTTGATFAWVDGRHAVVETSLLGDRVDAVRARCRPFHWDGAPEQRLRMTLNGRDLGSVVLRPSMGEYTLPVPPGVCVPGLNRLELDLAWAAVPADHLPDSGDRRWLAAAFETIAFEPVASRSAPRPADGSIADADELFMEPGTGLMFRLVAPRDAVVAFGLKQEPARSDLAAQIWIAPPGRPATQATTVRPAELGGGPARVVIDAAPGDVVDLGLAAIGDGGRGAGLTFVSPRVLGSGVAARPRPNLLLIVVDTLRADFLGAYGGAVETPNIDTLASAGVRFADARSHIPITGPSHASLFTSLLPMEHGVHNNAQELPPELPTLAEALQASGRSTAAVISLGVLQRQFGFARGFDHYGDGFPRDWLKDASEVTDEALGLAAGSLETPYFLWVHYSDPHEPYAPSDAVYPSFELRIDGAPVGTIDAGGRGFRFDVRLPPGDSVLEFIPLDEREPGRVYRVDNLLLDDPSVTVEALDGWHVIPRRMARTTYESELPATVRLTNPGNDDLSTGLFVSCKKLLSKPEIRDAYAGETAFVDRQIGRLIAGLQARGLMDDTLVIFLSDHGEGLGDHDHVGHISQVYDSLLDVPLIMSWPGRLPSGVVIDDPVGLVDVFPTAAELLGCEPPPVSAGISLVPLIGGEAVPARPIVAATYRPEAFSDKRALVLDGLKYIHSWRADREWEELYDVAGDPGELDDLASSRRADIERLRRELDRLLSAMREGRAAEVELTDQERAHLNALGYVH